MASISKNGEDDSFVIITNETETNGKPETKSKEEYTDVSTDPKIYEMLIESKVRNRYARTLITSKVRNVNSKASEATFSVILPEKAFISEFAMVLDEKIYKAYVKEKEEAKNIYKQAVETGKGAAQVAVSARESNRFVVSVNVEALSIATFLLTYEELLRRKDNMYELIINIVPKQLVNDLVVNVIIDESRPLKFVRTPALRSGNEIIETAKDLDPKSEINRVNLTTATVKFKPDVTRQKELATNLETDANKGLSGQFVVQYDVERDPNGGEVLVQDGYFVHFFAPTDIKPLNKFIIFVLDTSTSMSDGHKLTQLKQAMKTILHQLEPKDYFHIIGFDTSTRVWDIENHRDILFEDNSFPNFPQASFGIMDNIRKAINILTEFRANGCTNIHEALKIALLLIGKEAESRIHEDLRQPMIMFLTDGEPTVGVTDVETIVKDITKFNEQRTPIFTLSFGDGADKIFLKKLAQKNRGFSRHIYEASDAALQLQNFYKEIASPLLNNVKFKYVNEATCLTETQFPIHFGGSEIIVSGKLDGNTFQEVPCITCVGRGGQVMLRPTLETSVTSVERLWAYLTIQLLLEECETASDKSVIEKKALDLALKYSFVTPVSSLVVVRPDSVDSHVGTEVADKDADADSITPQQKMFIDTELVELPEEVSLVEICSFPKVKKRAICKRKIKKTTKQPYTRIVTIANDDESINEKIKRKRLFIWLQVYRLLTTRAIFVSRLFVSLFFYFLISFPVQQKA